MKKIFLIITLICMLQICNSQVFLSSGIDVKNAISGSKPTKYNKEIDLLFKLHLLSNNCEISVLYGSFNAIGFQRYSIGVGKQFNVTNLFDIVISLEPTIILRNETPLNIVWTNKSSHLSIGSSINLSREISNTIKIGISSNALIRTDLSAMYSSINKHPPLVFSNFLVIHIKIFEPK